MTGNSGMKPTLGIEEMRAMTRFTDLIGTLTLFASVPSEENEEAALAALADFPEVIRLNGRLQREWAKRNGVDLEQLQQQADEDLESIRREVLGPVRLIHSQEV